MTRKKSFLTVTDQFCGAGGSSIGATAAGVEIRMAMNHWKLAVETHNTNFPDADHDCADVSASNPRRYPSTDILITSPECTNHSLASGRMKPKAQGDMFIPTADDPAAERSRATMWDVPRFAEHHRYNIIIVENVVDARTWVPYESWLHAMTSLGYEHKAVYLNSMFCHPTPQSRDRMYVVFWRKGNRAPNLDIRPRAHCVRCARDVEAVQAWKNGRSFGRYKRQYVYVCPSCATEIVPYYYAALNAIDFSIPAERIADRTRPLQARTMERITYGLKKYGRTPLVVRTNMTSGIECRIRDAYVEPMDTQPGSNITALVSPSLPWLVRTGRTGGDRTHDTREAYPTQTTADDMGVAYAGSPFFVNVRHHGTERVGDVREHFATQTSSAEIGVALPSGFMCPAGSNDANPTSLDEASPTQTCTDRLGVVVAPAALLNMRDAKSGYLFRDLDQPIATQVASCAQDFLIQNAPFLTSYYGGSNVVQRVDEAIGTVSTKERHLYVQPTDELRAEDCYFRMLQPHEIGAAMAFRPDYVVLGNKREKVKQYGNAVTPPAMTELVRRCVESLS